MNVLLLGSGGREHAIAWKIAQSSRLSKLFIAPGNAGTLNLGTNLALDPQNFAAVSEVIRHHDINLVIIGPEAPLVEGLVDFLSPLFPDLPVVGPKANGARLEGSKAFSKAFMERHQIPTAAYREFSKSQLEMGITYLSTHRMPVVLKADGLAAGKGVLICQSHTEAIAEFKAMLGGKFGDASATVVVEEFLDGIEFSVFVLTDGKEYQILPSAKDYKRVGEGDEGLNTGGMGSVSPVPFLTPALMSKVEEKIIIPTIKGIRQEKMDYRGFVFFGLINVNGEPMVIEYNCRLGDPETQSVVARLKNDLLDLCLAVCNGTLGEQKIMVDKRTAATVVMVSGGYPGEYEKGKEISGLEGHQQGMIFHAGTKAQGDQIVTNGGRVLAVTSLGDSVGQAVNFSTDRASKIKFEGAYFRGDIGFDLI